MDNAITTQEQIDGAIEKKIDPIEIANVVYPRIEQAIETAKTPEEANTLRKQVGVVNDYIKKMLPKINQDRHEQFKYTFEGDVLYIEAFGKPYIVYPNKHTRKSILKGSFNIKSK